MFYHDLKNSFLKWSTIIIFCNQLHIFVLMVLVVLSIFLIVWIIKFWFFYYCLWRLLMLYIWYFLCTKRMKFCFYLCCIYDAWYFWLFNWLTFTSFCILNCCFLRLLTVQSLRKFMLTFKNSDPSILRSIEWNYFIKEIILNLFWSFEDFIQIYLINRMCQSLNE